MKVVWSPRARITFFRILDYLAENWTNKEVENFNERTENLVELIKKSPRLFPYSKEHDVYRCVLVRQVSLFYRIRNERIELLVFWDNRQDPAKLFAE
ncbi:MAG: type II toxin-antitoxin system RelE/ParE family toxin [Bacteroidota bacterium]